MTDRRRLASDPSRGPILRAILTRSVLAGALLAGFAAGARAEDVDEQNNHLGAFLRMGVDARHLAMGGTGAALANDAAAGYWNPAGLAYIRGPAVTAMATQGLNFDRRHAYAAGAWGWERAAVAFSWISAGTDDIPAADGSGNQSGETFDFSENAFILSAAARAGGASFGASAKLLTQDLGTASPGGGDDQVLGQAFDLGAQFFPTPFARVGFTIQNLFSTLGDQKEGRANDLPDHFRLGLALEPLTGFTVAADMVKARDDDNYRFHFGTELALPLGSDLSGAFRLGLAEGRYSGGFGLGFKALSVDYAYVIEPEAFLDENHRFSLSLDLGEGTRVSRDKGTGGDIDRDGFPDAEDQCPQAAEDFDSYEDFDGCPDLDNDGDGIPDLDDLCPDEAEDKDQVEDGDGCPDLDQDGDGIPDESDDCPGQAETKNGFLDEDGCPDTPITFPPVRLNFVPGSADLPDGSSIAALDEIVHVLNEQPTLRVEIQGHTDSQGDGAMNQDLSLRRAEAVKRYLTQHGVAEDRLAAKGYGESQPVASNSTPEGRAENRRIVFIPLER